MSSKVDLLKKQVAELQAQLIYWKEKTIVERSAPKVIKRPKVIGNIEEHRGSTVMASFKESSQKLYKIIWNQNH